PAEPPGRELPGRAPTEEEVELNLNLARRWSSAEQLELHQLVLQQAAAHFSRAEVDDLVNLVLKRERARSLEELASLELVSRERILEELRRFSDLPMGGLLLPPAEIMGTRVALIRRFVTDQLHLIGVAKNYLWVRDLAPILAQLISGSENLGRIGGKAAGLIIAHAILRRSTGGVDDPYAHTAARSAPGSGVDSGIVSGGGQPPAGEAAQPLRVRVPESRFLSSSVHEEFMQHNRLVDFRNQKYKPIEEIRRDYDVIVQIFRDSTMPLPVVRQLQGMLEELGEDPLVVRSSSLLEDSFGMAFSGKYRSVFLGNQGRPEDRLEALLCAIAEVYASVFHPDPIRYRRDRDMLDYDEQMGILIQKVVGHRHRQYYFPMAAGVAFSRNEFRWSQRIRKEDGLVRLVMGLGTRAVDRTGDDYPRMISLTLPLLRPEVTAQEIRRYSQRLVDVIDLEENCFCSVPVRQLLGSDPYTGLEQLISVEEEGHLGPPLFRLSCMPDSPFALTFGRFLAAGRFTRMISQILQRLRQAHGSEVDVEFAWEGDELFLLQCRPLAIRSEQKRVALPRGISLEKQIFTANRHVPTAQVEGVEVIVYVCPLRYEGIATVQEKLRVARCIGRLNETLAGRRFILMGPGRWGSNNIDLGVRVSYADICNTSLLVEIARERGGHVPEVSYGTHFFQDLVEAGIHPLPLYPDEAGVRFREDFLQGSPNSLPELAEDFADLAGLVQVIDLPRAAAGQVLDVIMDGEADEALAYLRPAG
ncbi:MAG: hypothetical protein FJ125_00775, partial [Deltaproteobacteria bacterium]|nr:hypothetical protein [Deltaproteobacteria bacterium]